MKIILANGAELHPILTTGTQRNVQGTIRDTLSFVFPTDVGLDELDGTFSAVNCEKITIVEGENEYIHNAYTVRVELKREPMVVSPATEREAEVIENRVTVTMGQRTYAESQMASLSDTVDVLVMESLME